MKTQHSTARLFTFPALLLITIFVGLTSCSDEPYYYDAPPFVGGWQLVGPPSVGYNEFVFYPDGSGTYYVNDYYGEDTYYMEWEVYGSQLTVYFPSDFDTMYFSWRYANGYLYLYPDGGGQPWVYSPF